MRILGISILFLFVSVPTVQAKPKIKQCTKRQKQELKTIRTFLKNNFKAITNSVADLTKREKKRLKKKVANVNYKCLDEKRVCKNHERYGKSRHLFGAAVVLCYDYHRKHGDEAYCELMDTVLHESAHAARVKKSRPHKAGDRVYRVGRAARKLCRARNLDRKLK